jgi:hypothetical protein
MGKTRNNVANCSIMWKARERKVADVGGMYYFTIGQSDIQWVCGWTFIGQFNIWQQEMGCRPGIGNGKIGPKKEIDLGQRRIIGTGIVVAEGCSCCCCIVGFGAAVASYDCYVVIIDKRFVSYI